MNKGIPYGIAGALLAGGAFAAYQPAPFKMVPNSTPIKLQTSADSVSNLVVQAQYGALANLAIKVGATAGFVMIFDAPSLPANGAVTPSFCQPVASNGTVGGAAFNWNWPIGFTNGIVVAFSSTGCDTLTASATAKIMAGAL